MSKRHGAKKHRKAKARKKAAGRVLCATCRVDWADPWALGAAIAAALNAAVDAGVKVRLRHYGIETGQGYVLRLPDGHWGARTVDFTTYPEAAAVAGDDLED